MTEAQAREIISKIDVAGWWRPIVDHLAARWALDRIAELERQRTQAIAAVDGTPIESHIIDNSTRDELEQKLFGAGLRIAELERLNEALAERVAAQAEMLAKRAEK